MIKKDSSQRKLFHLNVCRDLNRVLIEHGHGCSMEIGFWLKFGSIWISLTEFITYLVKYQKTCFNLSILLKNEVQKKLETLSFFNSQRFKLKKYVWKCQKTSGTKIKFKNKSLVNFQMKLVKSNWASQNCMNFDWRKILNRTNLISKTRNRFGIFKTIRKSRFSWWF